MVVVTNGAPLEAAKADVVAVDVPESGDASGVALSQLAAARAVGFLRDGGGEILAKAGGAGAKAEFVRRK